MPELLATDLLWLLMTVMAVVIVICGPASARRSANVRPKAKPMNRPGSLVTRS